MIRWKIPKKWQTTFFPDREKLFAGVAFRPVNLSSLKTTLSDDHKSRFSRLSYDVTMETAHILWHLLRRAHSAHTYTFKVFVFCDILVFLRRNLALEDEECFIYRVVRTSAAVAHFSSFAKIVAQNFYSETLSSSTSSSWAA